MGFDDRTAESTAPIPKTLGALSCRTGSKEPLENSLGPPLVPSPFTATSTPFRFQPQVVVMKQLSRARSATPPIAWDSVDDEI